MCPDTRLGAYLAPPVVGLWSRCFADTSHRWQPPSLPRARRQSRSPRFEIAGRLWTAHRPVLFASQPILWLVQVCVSAPPPAAPAALSPRYRFVPETPWPMDRHRRNEQPTLVSVPLALSTAGHGASQRRAIALPPPFDGVRLHLRGAGIGGPTRLRLRPKHSGFASAESDFHG